VVVVVVITVVAAAFSCLFEFMTPLLGLPAVFAMSADGFVQVPLGLFDAAMTPVIVAVQGSDRHGAAEQEQRGKDCRQHSRFSFHGYLLQR
jgi:hypothetical protein